MRPLIIRIKGSGVLLYNLKNINLLMNLYLVSKRVILMINGFNMVDGLYQMLEQKIILKLEKLRQ